MMGQEQIASEANKQYHCLTCPDRFFRKLFTFVVLKQWYQISIKKKTMIPNTDKQLAGGKGIVFNTSIIACEDSELEFRNGEPNYHAIANIQSSCPSSVWANPKYCHFQVRNRCRFHQALRAQSLQIKRKAKWSNPTTVDLMTHISVPSLSLSAQCALLKFRTWQWHYLRWMKRK